MNNTPLIFLLRDDARFFEQILNHASTDDALSAETKVNLLILAKARGVVVADSLGIAKGLENGRDFKHHVFDSGVTTSDGREIVYTQLGGFGFAST
jgi:hypothetical protein